MPRMYQVLTGRVVNPGATVTALTANTGDSFTIRNSAPGSPVRMEQAWAQEGTPGVFRITSNLLHDAVQGIRLRVGTTIRPLLPFASEELLQAQDALTPSLSGGAAETDVASFIVYYDDLAGASQSLASWEEVEPRVEHIVGVENNLTTGATAGQYGGALAFNANFDLLKKNRNYAILGYTCDVAVCTVGITGVATSNFRVGGPGSADPIITREWFIWLSQQTGRPHIPVINSADAPSYTVDAAAVQTATAVNVTWILALLSGSA